MSDNHNSRVMDPDVDETLDDEAGERDPLHQEGPSQPVCVFYFSHIVFPPFDTLTSVLSLSLSLGCDHEDQHVPSMHLRVKKLLGILLIASSIHGHTYFYIL